jgi:hypothetical protein
MLMETKTTLPPDMLELLENGVVLKVRVCAQKLFLTFFVT